MGYAEELGALNDGDRARWERYIAAHASMVTLAADDLQRLEATTAAYRSGDSRLSAGLHAVYREWETLRGVRDVAMVSIAADTAAQPVDSRGVLQTFADCIELRWPGVSWLIECTVVLRKAAQRVSGDRWVDIRYLNELVVTEMHAGRDHIGAVLAQAAVEVLHAPQESG